MLLHSSYGNLDYKKLELRRITKLVEKAILKSNEEKLWQVWLVLLKNMDKNNYISFEDYKKQIESFSSYTDKSVEELLQMAEKIKKADLNIRD